VRVEGGGHGSDLQCPAITFAGAVVGDNGWSQMCGLEDASEDNSPRQRQRTDQVQGAQVFVGGLKVSEVATHCCGEPAQNSWMAEYVFGGTTVGCKSPGRQPAHMVRQIGAGGSPRQIGDQRALCGSRCTFGVGNSETRSWIAALRPRP